MIDDRLEIVKIRSKYYQSEIEGLVDNSVDIDFKVLFKRWQIIWHCGQVVWDLYNLAASDFWNCEFSETTFKY